MIDAGVFLGYPIEFHKICLIYPPKVKDVVSNQSYGMYLKALTLSQEEMDEELANNGVKLVEDFTPFDYLLNNSFNSVIFNGVVREAFQFFTKEKITFVYDKKQIILGELAQAESLSSLRIIDENNFHDFQNHIRRVSSMPELPDPKEEAKLPARLREMRAKARYRDRVKAKSKDGLTLSTMLSSICCMNMGLNPLNIGELSYPAISTLFSVYQEKEKYELDVNRLLAGADSKKVKPKYWIRNLDE